MVEDEDEGREPDRLDEDEWRDEPPVLRFTSTRGRIMVRVIRVNYCLLAALCASVGFWALLAWLLSP